MSQGHYSGGGGYVPQSSQGSPGTEKKGGASIRAVTLHQIDQATQENGEAEFLFDGMEPTQITFVGQVQNAVPGAMNVNLKVIDGTGSIEVRYWPESREESEAFVESLPNMCWVRVLGNLKTFNDRKHVMAGRITHVTDHNEIFYHYLEALQMHLYFTQGPIGENGLPMATDHHSGIPSAYTSGGGDNKMDLDDDKAKWDPIAKRMWVWIRDHTTDPTVGVPMTDMARGIKDSGATAGQISEAIDWLQDNGHIFSTTDDDHYAVA